MNEFFIVSEIQNEEGTPTILNTVFYDENEAYSKYYLILSYAAVSTLPYHAATIYRGSDGCQVQAKVYKHVQPVESPTTEE